jgi:hypothetical protein
MAQRRQDCKANVLATVAKIQKNLSFFELTFLHHALVRFTHALDPIVELAIAIRKLPDNLIKTFGGIPIRIPTRELNFLSEAKSVLGHTPLHCC